MISLGELEMELICVPLTSTYLQLQMLRRLIYIFASMMEKWEKENNLM